MDYSAEAWLCQWLEQTQGVKVTPAALAEPARVIARIGGLARTAAAKLPSDTEPTGFTQFLETMAARQDGNA